MTIAGKRYVVEEKLGEGSQGEVWRVSHGNGSYALKWYFSEGVPPGQVESLEYLVEIGPPDSDRFLWPLEVTTTDGLGYLMRLRPPNYLGLTDVTHRRIEPSLQALARAGLELAHAFLQLHTKGLYYIDISWGNLFLDPASGQVLVCDNDNVRIDGLPAPVAGTPGFMAPEVERDIAAGVVPRPNRSTDLYALSVLLFYMLMFHHPLRGRRELEVDIWDRYAEARFYGTDPLFIFDPEDESNRPDPEFHSNAPVFWALYPQFVRDLFTRAFTTGLTDPEHGRVQESEWRQGMARLLDNLMVCPACGAENFFDPLTRSPGACWQCDEPLPVPMRLDFDSEGVVLSSQTRVRPHHLDRAAGYDLSRVVAEVVRHPSDPRVWGLRNATDHTWTAVIDGSESWEVPPGKSTTIRPGVRIHFGKREGRIVA